MNKQEAEALANKVTSAGLPAQAEIEQNNRKERPSITLLAHLIGAIYIGLAFIVLGNLPNLIEVWGIGWSVVLVTVIATALYITARTVPRKQTGSPRWSFADKLLRYLAAGLSFCLIVLAIIVPGVFWLESHSRDPLSAFYALGTFLIAAIILGAPVWLAARCKEIYGWAILLSSIELWICIFRWFLEFLSHMVPI